LIAWYEYGLRGNHSQYIGDKIIQYLKSEIEIEFPTTNSKEFDKFLVAREYSLLKDENWEIK
jgi:hypothetical protein